MTTPADKSKSYEEGKNNSQLRYIIQNHVRGCDNLNICDFGCGRGVFLGALSTFPEITIAKYLALDIDDTAIEETKKHLLNNPQIIKDSHICKPDDLDTERYSGKFDIVIMHHLLHEVDLHKVLEKVFKLLKPDGKMLIGDYAFFFWYEPDRVFWDGDSIKELLDSSTFEVNCISFTDADEKRREIFLAEAFLKPGASYPDVKTLLPRIKNIYEKKLKSCRNKINELGGPYSSKDIPLEVRAYNELESHIIRRLEKLEDIPEMKIIEGVNTLIERLKNEYAKWRNNYINQEGKVAIEGILPPHEFLEISQLKRLSEKTDPTDSQEIWEQHRFKKIGSGSLLDIVQRPDNQRLVLLGYPGVGKTTTLNYLSYYYAENFNIHTTVPVYIALKSYKTTGDWLSAEINHFLKMDIKEVTKSYRTLVMLDGYNEVSKSNLESLDSEINILLKVIDNSQTIITSRKATYPEFSCFNTCEIESLDDMRIKEYLKKALGHGRCDDAFSDITHKGLIELCRIPLFLEFTCELLENHENKTLPNNRGKLLETMVKVKYFRRPEERLRKYEVPDELFFSLLSEFCYNLIKEDGGIAFESDKLRGFISTKSEWIKGHYREFSTEEIMKEIKEHGIIEEHYHTLSFWHQTFFEYFAANYLKKILESKGEMAFFNTFLEHFKYKKWDEILSLCFDLMPEGHKAKLLKPFSICQDSNKNEVINLLIDISKITRASTPCIELLKHTDPDVRRSAARALGDLKSPEAVKPLLELLKDTDPDVRGSAADALGDLKSPEAVRPLIELLKDTDRNVNWSATDALVKIKSPEAVKLLIELLKDTYRCARRSAASALGEIKSPEAVRPLIELLQDTDLEVLEYAARALGKIKSPEAVRPLIELLKELKDTYPDVCSSAIDALVEIKSPEAVSLLIGIRWLRYANPELHSYAVRALGKTKSPKAVKPLIELSKDTYPDVRRSAADALGERKSPKAVKPLIEWLKNPDPGVRSSAASALIEIINILEEKEQLDVLDKVVKIGSADLYFYQALENIRYIPEDFTNDIIRNT